MPTLQLQITSCRNSAVEGEGLLRRANPTHSESTRYLPSITPPTIPTAAHVLPVHNKRCPAAVAEVDERRNKFQITRAPVSKPRAAMVSAQKNMRYVENLKLRYEQLYVPVTASRLTLSLEEFPQPSHDEVHAFCRFIHVIVQRCQQPARGGYVKP